MRHNIELIAYAVRKGLERDYGFKVSLTYPPTAKAMGESYSYVSVIALSQRLSIDYKALLEKQIAKNDTSFTVNDIGKVYIYYRNKITRADQEPELSSIEIGSFESGSFIRLDKFHVDQLTDNEIVKKIKDVVGKGVKSL